MILHADIVLALSKDMKEKIKDISGRKNIIIIPNRIDLTSIIHKIVTVKKECFASKILNSRSHENIKLLLYASRLVKFKGVHHLIMAMR